MSLEIASEYVMFFTIAFMNLFEVHKNGRIFPFGSIGDKLFKKLIIYLFGTFIATIGIYTITIGIFDLDVNEASKPVLFGLAAALTTAVNNGKWSVITEVLKKQFSGRG